MKFQLGDTYITPAAQEALAEAGQAPATFLDRHVSGDWGDCNSEDKEANEAALIDDERLLSVYHTSRGVKVWVITEADRSSTTILLPSEY